MCQNCSSETWGAPWMRHWRKPIVAVLVVVGHYVVFRVSRVEGWDPMLWATLFFLCMDVHKDRVQSEKLKFLPAGVVGLALLYFLYKNAADAWWKVAAWQMESVHHLWQWDQLFAAIPLNDPAFVRRFLDHPWLTDKLVWVYNFGFSFCIWAAVIRSYLARDWRKMLHYTMATHLLQTPLIIPFYNTVELHEVWWVLGRPDALGRPAFMDAYHLKLNAQNCFPSMHTSIAFAVLLLALRERGPIFKWGMAAYSAAVIFSTLYLEIHWTIDVVAGLAFGYGVVKLSDWVMARIRRRERSPLPGEQVPSTAS